MNYDFSKIEEDLGINTFTGIQNYTAVVKEDKIYNRDVSLKVLELTRAIENVDNREEMLKAVTDFYRKYGVGKYGLNRAFKLSHSKNEDFIIPITYLDDVVLDDLVGYDLQKEKLIRNTEAFVNGKKSQ